MVTSGIVVVMVGITLVIKTSPTKQAATRAIPLASSATTTSPTSTPAFSQSTTVSYTDAGFDKPKISVMIGTPITFVNKRVQRPMWVASNMHPEHLLYPEFDQGRVLGYEPLPKDTTFTFTFNRKGTWEYHDHYDAAQQGTVIVN